MIDCHKVGEKFSLEILDNYITFYQHNIFFQLMKDIDYGVKYRQVY